MAAQPVASPRFVAVRLYFAKRNCVLTIDGRGIMTFLRCAIM